jgi:hypothetical protein
MFVAEPEHRGAFVVKHRQTQGRVLQVVAQRWLVVGAVLARAQDAQV